MPRKAKETLESVENSEKLKNLSNTKKKPVTEKKVMASSKKATVKSKSTVKKTTPTEKSPSVAKTAVKTAEAKSAKTTKKSTSVAKRATKKAEAKSVKTTKKSASAAKTTTKKAETKSAKTTKKSTSAAKSTTKKAETKSAKTTKKSTSIAKPATKKTETKSVKTTKKSTSVAKTATKKAETKSAKTTKKSTSIAKPATKKVETKSAKTAKKSAPKKTATILPEYYDLPYHYDQTVVKVLAQTPKTLFVYWDVSEEDKNNLVNSYGASFFDNTIPFLRVINKTDNYYFDIDVDDFANGWYLHVNDSMSDYTIELYRKQRPFVPKIIDQTVYIASSNTIETPNDHILFDINQDKIYFKNVKTKEVLTKKLHLHKTMGKIYNIYDLYKKIYKNEDVEELFDLNNPSSGNPTSTFK